MKTLLDLYVRLYAAVYHWLHRNDIADYELEAAHDYDVAKF